ncbi:MAG TPA: CHRD domain-containing protein, partial [Anaerolineae bacterium]|nr:CHRD domain-containing protein [Anaerolineae bacterium]
MRIRLLSAVLLSVLLITLGTAALADAPDRAFIARLSGEAPGVVTEAWGHAVFNLSDDGTVLHYRLIVHNLDDVLMAHIHLAPPGENGPVVAWLYPDAPPAQLIPGR